jgi:hypothetical protein
MKSIALVILFFLFASALRAQLGKEQWMFGGTADFFHDNTETSSLGLDDKSNSTGYKFAPGIGFFVIDRLCVGLRFNIASIKSTHDQSSANPTGYTSHFESKTSGWGISPFVRYYFLPGNHKVNIFADGAYSNDKRKTTTKGSFRQTNPPPGSPSAGESFSKTNYTNNSFSIAAGPVIFINPKVSFELSVGYIHSTAKKQNLKTNSVLIGTGFQVYLAPLKPRVIDKKMGKL